MKLTVEEARTLIKAAIEYLLCQQGAQDAVVRLTALQKELGELPPQSTIDLTDDPRVALLRR